MTVAPIRRPRTAASQPATHDAIVVGARVAGAATAMLLARAGLRVLVLDRARPDADTLSTHALMRGGVLQLRRWGLLDGIVDAGTPPIRRTIIHYGDDAEAVDISAKAGVDALYNPRRTLLDPLLVDAAVAAGAEVRFGADARAIHRDGSGRVTGVAYRDRDGRTRSAHAAITIGADGPRSLIARTVHARDHMSGQGSSAMIYGYWSGLSVDGDEWFYRPGVAAGLIPTNGEHVGVWVGTATTRFRAEFEGDLETVFGRLLRQAAPEIAARIPIARHDGRLRGHLGAAGYLRQPWGPGWALVGDAGYLKDPITAHGITDALRDAELLARAITAPVGDAADELAAYQRTRDQLSRRMFAITDAVASYAWDLPRLRDLLIEQSREMSREARAIAALDHGAIAA
jgi:flavin-dependent dehydrogenase